MNAAPELFAPLSRFADRFSAIRTDYVRFRPDYPNLIVGTLARHIVGVPAPADSPTVDVGSGTGIFTRQLAAALPSGFPVIGVEPAEGMRQAAIEESNGLGIDFRDGLAEALPANDGEARAVVAATAAHWFDRPRFFKEAGRVLVADGVLAITEYRRDLENPAAIAVDTFLAREGGPKAYSRPDYLAEIEALEGFDLVDMLDQPTLLPLDIEGFVGLALSSSHAKPVVAKLGLPATRAALTETGERLADASGTIGFGYRFSLLVARHTGI